VSDTAISSQIALEANASHGGAGTSSTDSNSLSESQGSEFKQILDDSQSSKIQQNAAPENSDSAESQQDLINLNALFNATLLANSPTAGLGTTAVAGNVLPLSLRQASGLAANPGDALLAAKLANSGPGAAPLNPHTAEANPLLANNLSMTSDLLMDDGLLTTQLTANFTENSAANLKQLNAQWMGQALLKQDPTVEQNLPLTAQSSFMLNQNLLLKPSESMLPAITVSPDNAQWNNQVGERINWMVNSQMQRAEIRLDPPELGSLDIRLNIAKDNQATVMFYVSNATAKEAIESAIPRLREMFEQQGLNLGDVDVSQQSFQQQQQSAFTRYDNADSPESLSMAYLKGENVPDGDVILAATDLSAINSTNLLDIFA